jgi:hypothetical protein
MKFCAVNALLSLVAISTDVADGDVIDEGEAVGLVAGVVQPATNKEASTSEITIIVVIGFNFIRLSKK